MQARNPHRICTWDDEANCVGCDLRGELNCRWDSKVLKFFIAKEMPPVIIAVFGMVLAGIATGLWWPLVAFAIACIALWGAGIETRILCSHCPFYAEESKTLHCLALHGSPKWWRYRPHPMNRVEKATLISFFSILLLLPILAEAYGIWFISARYAEFGLVALLGMIGITLATIIGGLLWLFIMSYAFCSSCINFSCPLNRVPRSTVNKYLEKNPVMKDAWAGGGHKQS